MIDEFVVILGIALSGMGIKMMYMGIKATITAKKVKAHSGAVTAKVIDIEMIRNKWSNSSYRTYFYYSGAYPILEYTVNISCLASKPTKYSIISIYEKNNRN